MRKRLAWMALLLGFVAAVAVGCGTPKGKLYTLQEAYDSGWLTKDDLMSIAYYHNGGREHNEDIMTEDYAPQPKTPEAIDKATEQGIKNAAAWELRNDEIEPIPEAAAEGFTILEYYGSYSGCYVILMRNHYELFPTDVPREWKTIAEVQFLMVGYSRLCVWKAKD